VHLSSVSTSSHSFISLTPSLFPRCEEILSRQRYIAGGSHPTEADVRLYQTLIRFDPVYVVCE
jgi:glutathionyl-hydroquinone reductase